jgi:serine/threonine-protein kinase
MALGESDLALEELESSFETRTGWILPFLGVDPVFDPLREDPRFQDLLARIGMSGRRGESPSAAGVDEVPASVR